MWDGASSLLPQVRDVVFFLLGVVVTFLGGVVRDITGSVGTRWVERQVFGAQDELDDWYTEVHTLGVRLRHPILDGDFYADDSAREDAEEAFQAFEETLSTPPDGVDTAIVNQGQRVAEAFRDLQEADPDEELDDHLIVQISQLHDLIRAETDAIGRDPSADDFQ